MSAEPPTAAWVQGKRWEDLIEAATSATEADDDRDLTPVCPLISSFLCFVAGWLEEIRCFGKELHPEIAQPSKILRFNQ
jgi:hypothetical protein